MYLTVKRPTGRLLFSLPTYDGIYTRKNGTFQLRIVNKLLPKDLWATFDTYDAADQYGKQLEGLLAQGVVPTALLERTKSTQVIWTVHRCVAEYIRDNAVPVSEIKLLV